MINDEKHRFTGRRFLAATAAIVTLFLAITAMSQTADAKGIEGTVMLGHQPMAGVTVTLWRTAGEESPESLRKATTDSNGRFAFHVVMARADGNVFYLTTRGGAADTLALMSVLGAEPQGHPAGTKTGDAIHVFQSGSIQMVTDVSIDPAGNAWVANNWNNIDAVGDADPARSTSTWGGGSGIVVIYGVAAPVKTPLMGPMRRP
jgi:hypothetical protein